MQKPLQIFDIREVFPYLAAFNGEKFVITVDANLLLDNNNGFVDDLVLLISCGMRFVVIPDERALLAKYKTHPQTNQVIIPSDKWRKISRTLAYRHFKISAAITRSLRKNIIKNTTENIKNSMSIVSGNYVIAKERGIHNATDLGKNGQVRSIDKNLLQNDLIANQVVLIPTLSPSSTGSIYWIGAEELGEHLAIAAGAQKWIVVAQNSTKRYFSQELLVILAGKLTNKHSKTTITPPSEITAKVLTQVIKESKKTNPLLSSALSAINNGVGRVNIIAFDGDKNRNNLLRELFTHQGCGTVISTNTLDDIRPATLGDINRIIEIIAPFENNGTLMSRTNEQLQESIQNIIVITHDGLIIACAALLPIEGDKNAAEFACFAVTPEHQKRGVGKRLLNEIVNWAKKQKIQNIYLLTSRAHEWFRENGFKTISEKKLPLSRQKTYDKSRSSKVMVKVL